MKGPYSYSLPMNAALIGYARCSTDDQDLTAQVHGASRCDARSHPQRVRFLGRESSEYDRRSSPPEKSRPRSSLKIGSRQVTEKHLVSIRYRNSYYRFGTFCAVTPLLYLWSNRTGSDRIDVEEFEADAVAFVVGRRFGLNANSAEYLKGYLNDNTVDSVNNSVLARPAGGMGSIFARISFFTRTEIPLVAARLTLSRSPIMC